MRKANHQGSKKSIKSKNGGISESFGQTRFDFTQEIKELWCLNCGKIDQNFAYVCIAAGHKLELRCQEKESGQSNNTTVS